MIASFFDQLAGWASVTPRWSGSGITRLAIELGDLPGHPARTLARRSKAATEAWLAERLAAARISDASARARDLMLLMEGAMVLTLIHGDRTYFDAAARAAALMEVAATRAFPRHHGGDLSQVARANLDVEFPGLDELEGSETHLERPNLLVRLVDHATPSSTPFGP
jgi:hypothetical protein